MPATSVREHVGQPVSGRGVLFRAIRDSGWSTVVLAGAALAGAAAELALPAAMGRTVDTVVRGAGAGTGPWLVACVGLIAAIAAGEILADLAAGMGGARATARLRHALVRHLVAVDLSAVRRYPEGDLVSRIVAQVAVAGQAGPAVVLCAVALVPSLGSVVALALIDPWLAVTFVAGLLVLAGLLRTYVSDLADAATRYQGVQSGIAARLVEALAGARTIRAAGTVEPEIDRVLDPLADLHDAGTRTWDAAGQATARGAVAAPLTQLAVVAVGGLALAAGRISPGELLAALQYATLGAGLGAAVSELGRLARSRAAGRRAAEILAVPARSEGTAELPAGPGCLELRAVTVRHGEDGPLDRVSLAIPGGCTVAVVGPSGAGRSTLAAVVGRFVDPDEGEVVLDGVPLHRLRRTALRDAVGYAFARPVLVGDTVADAIALGARPPVEPAAVRAAARVARVDAVVERLPDGYATALAEAPLSGGEAQRLGLARAVRAGRVLVLDDALSSLDTVTEYQISQALTRPDDPRTRIVVTHRVATAARADLVAWLDDGRLLACAPHHVLWADSRYRALFHAGGADRW